MSTGAAPADRRRPSSGSGGGVWRDYLFCSTCGGDPRAAVAAQRGGDGVALTASERRRGEAVEQEFSPAARAAYKALRVKHFWHYNRQWDVSSGRLVAVLATPRVVGEATSAAAATAADGDGSDEGNGSDESPPAGEPPRLPPGHSDWFPHRLGELVSSTETWCDVLNLGPPDGLFMDVFADAVAKLHDKKRPIVVRMMFGNVLGIGNVNCRAVVARLTAAIPDPENTKLRLWVGAWRKGVSWNHSKILAVDGNALVTGGHNLWDEHYLKRNPVLDLSMEMEGPVAQDAHLYANEQWRFVEKLTTSEFGAVVNKIQSHKYAPVVFKSFITLRRYPRSAPRHPPNYVVPNLQLYRRIPKRLSGAAGGPENVPMLSMGRCGAITALKRRPSDDAIVAMLDTAKHSLRLALQDLGPVCIPGTKIPLPGCIWPWGYLNALGRVLWTTDARIDILLSNPLSVPGELTMMQAMYGNGWTCVDVAAELIKTVLRQYPIAAKLNSAKLRQKVSTQIRVSYLRGPDGSCHWPGAGKNSTRAFHAKHFIVDGRAFYIGSQNLYISDLAEWGVVVDDRASTEKVLTDFWTPLWERSYRPEDCDVQAVMDGLRVGRDGESPMFMSASTRKLLQESVQTRQSVLGAKASAIIAATRVANAFQQAGRAEDGVEVEASTSLAAPSTGAASSPQPAAAAVGGDGGGGAARKRFRALGQIAVLAQSQQAAGANNQDLYYLNDEDAKQASAEDDDSVGNGDERPALAKITALKFLAKRQLRRNTA